MTIRRKSSIKAAGVRDLIIEVFGLNGRLVETGNRLTKQDELTTALWQVLGALGFADRALTVPEIARRMGLTRQSVQRSADVLAKRGLVSFAENPRHRRSALASLTEQGKTALGRAEAAHQPLSTRLSLAIGQERIAAALSVLREMNALLAEDAVGRSKTKENR